MCLNFNMPTCRYLFPLWLAKDSLESHKSIRRVSVSVKIGVCSREIREGQMLSSIGSCAIIESIYMHLHACTYMQLQLQDAVNFPLQDTSTCPVMRVGGCESRGRLKHTCRYLGMYLGTCDALAKRTV